jgi:hypothetical protein
VVVTLSDEAIMALQSTNLPTPPKETVVRTGPKNVGKRARVLAWLSSLSDRDKEQSGAALAAMYTEATGESVTGRYINKLKAN